MFFITLYIAKITRIIMQKILHRNATNYPGKLALKLYPKFLEKVGKPNTVIAVTGTDGKTTVNNLIIKALENSGYKVLNNSLGSNTNSGIATSLLADVNFFNKSKHDIAVLEIDERSAKRIYPFVKPKYLICTNLFRDSIYRNAHPQFIFDIINSVIPEETTLILNADDPISSQLGSENKKIFFSIGRQETDKDTPENIINDLRICPKCNSKLKYNFSRYHHIGDVYCPNCDFKSPKPDYQVTSIDYDKNELVVNHNEEETKYHLISNQMFNIYNEVTLITFLNEMGLSQEQIKSAVEQSEIVSTRYTKENIDGINIITNAAKGLNAVACSCVFDSIKRDNKDKEIILFLDDFFEARESSENITWLYDTDFEFLNSENIKKIIPGGKRAKDYYLRLLLAGIPEEKIACSIDEYSTPDYLSLDKDRDIYILFDIYNNKIAEKVKAQIVTKIRGENND